MSAILVADYSTNAEPLLIQTWLSNSGPSPPRPALTTNYPRTNCIPDLGCYARTASPNSRGAARLGSGVGIQLPRSRSNQRMSANHPSQPFATAALEGSFGVRCRQSFAYSGSLSRHPSPGSQEMCPAGLADSYTVSSRRGTTPSTLTTFDYAAVIGANLTHDIAAA
jgi:hypothetical protein